MNQEPINTAINSAITDITVNTMAGKKFWESKTFWTNAVAAAALLIQMRWGFIIGPEIQALALTAINLALRKVTTQPITW